MKIMQLLSLLLLYLMSSSVVLAFSFNEPCYGTGDECKETSLNYKFPPPKENNCLGPIWDYPGDGFGVDPVVSGTFRSCYQDIFEIEDSTYFDPKIGIEYEIEKCIKCWPRHRNSNRDEYDPDCVRDDIGCRSSFYPKRNSKRTPKPAKAILSAWGGCKVINNKRFCARVTQPGKNGADYQYINSKKASLDPSPNMLPRMCVYQDPSDVTDLIQNFMPFHHETPMTENAIDVLIQDAIGSTNAGSEQIFIPTDVLSDIAYRFASFLGLPINNKLRGIVNSKCIQLPIAPYPPPFNDEIRPLKPKPTIFPVCEEGTISTKQQPCLQGNYPSSFEVPRLKFAYNDIIPSCDISSSGGASLIDCVNFSSNLISKERIADCTKVSQGADCVNVPASLRKDDYLVLYQVFNKKNGSQISETPTIWYSLSGEDANNESLRPVAVVGNEFKELGFHFNNNAPVPQTTSSSFLYQGKTIDTDFKTKISLSTPDRLCLYESIAGNEGIIDCIDRPNPKDFTIESCPPCNLQTESEASCMAKQSPIFGASCISSDDSPKLIFGFRSKNVGSTTIPAHYEIFSVFESVTQNVSKTASKFQTIHGKNFNIVLLDQNYDPAFNLVQLSSNPVDSSRYEGYTAVYRNCVANPNGPNEEGVFDPRNECDYEYGIVEQSGDYFGGAAYMCVSLPTDEKLLAKINPVRSETINGQTNYYASNKPEDVVVPLYGDNANTKPYKIGEVKQYNVGFPDFARNYGQNPVPGSTIERDKNEYERGLCVTIPGPICGQLDIEDFKIGSEYKINFSKVANLVCPVAPGGTNCVKKASGDIYDSGLDKTINYDFDFKWECKSSGTRVPRVGSATTSLKSCSGENVTNCSTAGTPDVPSAPKP